MAQDTEKSRSRDGQFAYDEVVVEMEPSPLSKKTHKKASSEKTRKKSSRSSPSLPPAKHQKTLHKSVDTPDSDIPDPRAFPHHHSLFHKLKQTFCNVDIGPRRLSKILRQYLVSQTPENCSEERMLEWRLNFQRIAHTLDLLLSNDSESCLDPVERLTLEDLLARPPMFACVLVPRLVPSLEKLVSSEIVNIYSEFLNFVRHPWDLAPQLPSPSQHMPIKPDVQSPSSSIHNNLFLALKLTLVELASKKSDLRILKQDAADAAGEPLQHIYIHRLEFVPNHVEFEHEILAKTIVIDCPDYVRFPSRFRKSTSNVKVGTLGDEILDRSL
jgi:hypothetical protein